MLKIKPIPLFIALMLASSAYAAPMSKADYTTAKSDLSAALKADKSACKSQSGNAKDICVEEAKSKEKIARAELEVAYEPSEKHNYALRKARADTVFAVAKERCDDLAGNAKNVCKEEAKAAHITGLANAKLIDKTVDNNTTANDKIESAANKANDKNADAQMAADKSKRNAAYALAKEKCDSLSSDAKDNCVNTAKNQFGQN